MPILRFSKKTSAFFWKRRKKIFTALFIFIAFLGIFSYLTNPFTKFSIIDKNIVSVGKVNNQIAVTVNDRIFIKNNFIYRKLALSKSGWHIFVNRLDPRSTNFGNEVDTIINNIHEDRFAPDAPFLISGEHFSVLYPRSLGIFYHMLLDPRIALNTKDWEDKQSIYLKTLTLILETYKNSKTLSTTIVPIFPRTVTLVNIYAPPSDTLFSILHALQSLQSDDNQKNVYTFESDKKFTLQTKKSSAELLKKYKQSLIFFNNQYKNQLYDPTSGLVKKTITLSSAKDSVKRSSAFYDNVIFWKTQSLAQELGITEKNPSFLNELKERIIETFWLEKEGYFLEELSSSAVINRWYSSDWLIAYETGFLDPASPRDRQLLIRSVQYIVKNKIDEPFGLRYQNDIRPKQLHRTVRMFAKEYGSTAIWSHWGMEYTKLLIRLAQETENKDYLYRAGRQLEAYKYNIERYGGFPEVYEENGDIFKSRFYVGVRSTGWIVNYEQAQAMYQWTRKKM